MIQKRVLTDLISKYFLGGAVEKAAWVSKDGIKVNFVNDSKNLAGHISGKGIEFPEGKFGIYNTSQLNKMLGIMDGELLVDVQKSNGIASKFNIQDTNFDLSFYLADPAVMPKVPQISGMEEPNVKFMVNKELISRFIKSKGALSEHAVFTVATEDGFTCRELVFTLGGKTTNQIMFKVEVPDNSNLEQMPFDAELFKEILKANKDCDTGEISVYSKGMMISKFTEGDVTSKYYLIRQQEYN